MPENRSIIAKFIELRAERKLQELAMALCAPPEGLTPEVMEMMVKKDLTLSDLLLRTGRSLPKVSNMARPGVNYLVSLPDEKILALLEQVVPDNVAVLRRYPSFCNKVIRDLKTFASG